MGIMLVAEGGKGWPQLTNPALLRPHLDETVRAALRDYEARVGDGGGGSGERKITAAIIWLLKFGVVDRGARESASKYLSYVEGLSLLCCCLIQPSLAPLVDRPAPCEGFVCEVKRCALGSDSPARLLAKRICSCV